MFPIGVAGDSLSLATHYLRMIPKEASNALATCTGFVYEYENARYLITNGHNITRTNPETNERIARSIAFADRIKTKYRYKIGNYSGSEFFEIQLYDNEEQTIPRWFVHPKFEYKVDVVAIPINNKLPDGAILYPINKFDLDEQFYPEVSDDVFVLGYPFDLTGGKELPIWKKGSIATEPGLDLDNLPKILIDTATRAGMSGSPVIFKRSGIHGLTGVKMTGSELIGIIKGFVGIYSGRIGNEDNFQSQLGIVWKKNVIEEILESKKIGNIDFQNH